MSANPELQLPDTKSRLRCGHCGNLTRFDVTRSSTVKEFWHVDMSGAVTLEEQEVAAEHVLAIACRWCGAGDRIEIVLRPEFGGPSQESPGDGGV
jgi:RNase P subunit RPR2